MCANKQLKPAIQFPMFLDLMMVPLFSPMFPHVFPHVFPYVSPMFSPCFPNVFPMFPMFSSCFPYGSPCFPYVFPRVQPVFPVVPCLFHTQRSASQVRARGVRGVGSGPTGAPSLAERGEPPRRCRSRSRVLGFFEGFGRGKAGRQPQKPRFRMGSHASS